jgi:hypothetical protein
MEEQKMNNTKRIIISILVVFILFVLPAGSWLYLQRGLDYHIASKSELQELGKTGDFQLANQKNIPISPEMIRGKVSVIHFLPENREEGKILTDRMAKVHQSFDGTEDVVFLSFMPSDSSTQLLDIANAFGIRDDKQWYLIGAEKSEWERLANEVYKIPNPATGVALVDTSLTIRKYYDINVNKEMGRLVEHIAMIIPEQKRR